MKVGDVVRVQRKFADTYVQPYRKWITEGRMADVVALPDQYPGQAILQFRTARPAKRQADYRQMWAIRELEFATPGAEQGKP